MKKTIKSLSFITIITLLASCGSSEKSSNAEVNSDSVKTAENTVDSAAIDELSVLYNIPSPIETFTVLKMTGAKFDKSLLNQANNITKYNSSYSKALNLGTYSADLSFCLLYKQNQDINIYLKNVNELTSALDIDGSYVQTTAQRLKVNSNNLDSIMLIVSEATVNANLYLKENQRDNVTALVTTGGWIEGMYFITNIASKTNKKEILDLVADQKNVVKNLVKALEQFSEGNQEITGLLNDVKEIEAIYNSLTPVQNVAVASTENEVVSIGNNSSIELTKEQLKSILDKVTALRSKLTA
jgi:hypothetical protein